MKIISWNPNGIRALMKKISIKDFIKKYQPDILCFNEIKASTPISNIYLQLEFKNQYWNVSKAKKGYAGTVVLSKIKPINVIKSPFDDEGRLICLEFEEYYLINVYVANAGQDLKRLDYRIGVWDVKLREFVSKLDKPVIIMGDMNVAHKEIDIARPKYNLRTPGFTIEERESYKKLLDLGFVDTFRHFYPTTIKYTYWGYRFKCREKNIGWRIDAALVNKDLMNKVVSSEILDEEVGSDHCPIVLELSS